MAVTCTDNIYRFNKKIPLIKAEISVESMSGRTTRVILYGDFEKSPPDPVVVM